jgi:predicted amidohydrolase YtcJ
MGWQRPVRADVVLAGGRVWTGARPTSARGSVHFLDAVALAGGRVVALGSDALELRTDAREVVDVAGGLVMPAFGDGHAHPIQGGLEEAGPAVREAASVAGVADAVRVWAAAHPDAEWIIGGSYDPTLAPGGRFDANWLDAAVADRPVVLRAADYHTVWCNSEALRRVGVGTATPDPAIGRIERREDGSPLGTLREWQACDLVLDAAPRSTPSDLEAALRRAAVRFAAAGVTWVQDAWVDLDGVDPGAGALDAWLALAGRGDLPLRAGLALRADPLTWREQVGPFLAARARADAEGAGRVTARTVKIFADGVVEGGTAAMLEVYADDPQSSGMPVWDWAELREACAAFDAQGFQLHVHAIGDAAVRAALDAVEHAIRVNGPRDRRPVIAHAQVVHPDDLPRFAALPIVVNLEPLWAQRDALMDELTVPRLGAERTRWQYPMASLLRSGARISFGSDWPVSSLVPLEGVRVAVMRTTPDGRPPGGWLPGERLTVEEALTAYTAGVGYQSFEDDRGTLAVGARADVVVLDRDVLGSPPEAVGEAQLVAAWCAGTRTA